MKKQTLSYVRTTAANGPQQTLGAFVTGRFFPSKSLDRLPATRTASKESIVQ